MGKSLEQPGQANPEDSEFEQQSFWPSVAPKTG
jgi:hypothetical protein